MNNDFSSFLTEIKEHTDLKIAIFNERGVFLFGDGKQTDRCEPNFDNIILSNKEKATYFKLKFKGNNYIARLDGADEQTKQTAFFIQMLSSKTALKKEVLDKENLVKNIVLGNISYYQVNKYVEDKTLIDGEACVFLVILDEDKTEEVIELINSYNENSQDFAVKLKEGKCVLVKYIDEATEEYRSINEYAEFLARFILEETGLHVSIYIGCAVKRIADLALSYEQASISQKMNERFNEHQKIHSYKDYVLIRMIEDLPKHKLSEYLYLMMDPSAKEIFEDKEIVNTAEQFLEHSLNISETSRAMFLHRNTLTYRLDKIEKATGLDLRKFSDALTFRLITVLTELVG